MKLPHFFKYAKDKEEVQVDKINNSTVNKLYKIIPNKPIQFKKVAGNYDYKLLLNSKDTRAVNKEQIIETFIYINRSKRFMLGTDGYQEEGFIHYLKDELLKLCNSESLISDILTEYFYINDSAYKVTLWSAYGEYMYKALESKLEDSICCFKCSKRVEKTSNKQVYCKPCATIIDREKAKERKNKNKKFDL